MPRRMHFAQYLMHGPTYHSIAMWRHPRTDRSYDWRRPELYQHVARVAEQGKLDMVFFADFQLHLRPLPELAGHGPPLRHADPHA